MTATPTTLPVYAPWWGDQHFPWWWDFNTPWFVFAIIAFLTIAFLLALILRRLRARP